MDLSLFKDMLHKDMVTAGYGVVASNVRKVAGKALGSKGIGQAGVNVLSVVVGLGLSQVNNPHVKIIGAALRISGIASLGNSVLQKIAYRNKEES